MWINYYNKINLILLFFHFQCIRTTKALWSRSTSATWINSNSSIGKNEPALLFLKLYKILSNKSNSIVWLCVVLGLIHSKAILFWGIGTYIIWLWRWCSIVFLWLIIAFVLRIGSNLKSYLSLTNCNRLVKV